METMNPKQVKSISKFLSLVLRHKPETINISMDTQGWVSTDELIEKMNAKGKTLNLEMLEYIVENNNKKRFTFNENKSRIKANQGHSLTIDHGFKAVEPPEFLYHGTAIRFIESIQKTGLDKRNRHHVHLTSDLATAKSVGGRYGKPVILSIKAKVMHAQGFEFYCTENQVWLTEAIPVQFIEFPT